MSNNVVNLNKVRKAREQALAKEQARENRAKFGRTKSEKTRTEAEKEKADRTLDGARREPEDDAS
ncbi:MULTISPECIES: DUF4169 family protein [Phenylobacterium]|uniref:DUF4169 domain-containing protein n=1 Tax=Phenylobacterium koreense TaxID=266125 RepID=A0ABV2EDP2_9CAUL